MSANAGSVAFAGQLKAFERRPRHADVSSNPTKGLYPANIWPPGITHKHLVDDALAHLDSGVLHWLTQSIPTPVQQETANHDSWFSPLCRG
jgi:hypothetical protein